MDESKLFSFKVQIWSQPRRLIPTVAGEASCIQIVDWGFNNFTLCFILMLSLFDGGGGKMEFQLVKV